MAASNEERRNLIVNEIESWRRSKLLPEQYCDFLQNIYLEDLNERPQGIVGRTVKKVGQATGKQWAFYFAIFSLICFVVLYFSVFPLALQIGISAVVTAAFILVGSKVRKSNAHQGLIVIGSGMAFLAVSSFSVIAVNHWVNHSGMLWLLALCAIVWITLGLLLRFALLHWVGWIAVIILYSTLLSQHISNSSWIEVQVYWIPASILFGWVSWFFQIRNKSVSAVFFTTALILWFMPEVYSAIHNMNMVWIQTQLIVKIVIVGVGMFRLRKQWMEWVV